MTQLTRSPSNSVDSSAPTESGSPRPKDSAPGGLPEGFWPILPKALALCRVESLAVAQALIDRYPAFFFFSSHYPMCYTPFANDFGPVNLAVVHAFYLHMHKYCSLPELATRQIVYYVADNKAAITNASFLLASYLVIELGYTPEEAWAPFQAIPDITAYRDVTEECEGSEYELTVLACLEGLCKALSLGWYHPDTFDAEEYTFLSSTSSLDMSLVSPKFCAFRGPLDSKLTEVYPGVFTSPPSQYMEAFKRHKVSTVVRLNEASTYQKSDFVKEGLDHRDLYFDDCTTPSRDIIDKFLRLAEAAPGVVAVHCKAGLGRTGTLIAIHMMKHQGLTASECIGWLRIARPGSVIGTQQHFLHWVEGQYRRVDKLLHAGSLRRSQNPDARPPPPRSKSAETVLSGKTPSELCEEIARAQMRRDVILAKAATHRDPSPLKPPPRRARPSPKTPIEAAVPLTPENTHVQVVLRPILRKRSSLATDLADLTPLPAAATPGTALPLVPGSSGGSLADSKASTCDAGAARRRPFPSISVGSFLRSVSRPFASSLDG